MHKTAGSHKTQLLGGKTLKVVLNLLVFTDLLALLESRIRFVVY